MYVKLTVDEVADRCVEIMTKEDGDALMAFCGAHNIGKSTAMTHFLIQTYEAIHKVEYPLEKYFAYNKSDVTPLLLYAPQQVSIGIDENAFYAHEWAQVENRFNREVLMQIRDEHRYYGVCAARIGDLDEYTRNLRVSLWVQITEKGHADVYRKDNRIVKGDPWWLDDDSKRRQRCRLGWFKFDKMDDKIRTKYLEIKKNSKQKLKDRYENFIKKKIELKNAGTKGRGQGVSYEKVGRIIRQTRVELNLTQSQFSELYNIPVATVRLYEQSIQDKNSNIVET